MVSVFLAGSMVGAFALAAFAPAPPRPVAHWLQVLVGIMCPIAFCLVMAATSAGEREAGALAMWLLAASLACLLWLLRAPGEDSEGDDGGGDDDGGTGRRKPSGGPGNPDDGLRWDWDRFEAEFASYAARSTSDRELAGIR